MVDVLLASKLMKNEVLEKILKKTGVFYGNFWHSWGFKLAVSGRKDMCCSIKIFWHAHTPKKQFPTILEQKQHLKWSNKKKLPPPPENTPFLGGGGKHSKWPLFWLCFKQIIVFFCCQHFRSKKKRKKLLSSFFFFFEWIKKPA